MSGDNFWIITDWNLPDLPQDKWELGDIEFHDDKYPRSYGIGIKSDNSVKVVCLLSPADDITDYDRSNGVLLLQAPKMLHMLKVVAEGIEYKPNTDEWNVRLSPWVKERMVEIINSAEGGDDE